MHWPYNPEVAKQVTGSDEAYSLKNKSTMQSNREMSRQSSVSIDQQVATWTHVFVPDEEANRGLGRKPGTIQEEDSETYMFD